MAAEPVDPSRAWAAYEPSSACPWTLARAAHLWRRAGFGATWEELRQALGDGPRKTVDRLLKGHGDVAAFNRTFDENERMVSSGGSAEPLRAWWLRRMIQTPHPLLEKMTLFWHDFVAASAARVGNGSLVCRHIQLLRSAALGSFPSLLAGVTRDAMVFLSLGAKANRKAMPDDNLARQLLCRWTVGPAACTESDVRQAARAMTGWFVLRDELRHFDREHDDGPKTVLGKAGRFNDQDVVRIAATHPAAARNVVRRLYRWFLDECDAPDEALIAPLVRSFAADGDIARLVETMLRSNLFFRDRMLRRRVKRPTEFAVGIVRALEGNAATSPLADDLAALGENLCYPPTRDGWEGGRYWINRATVIGRGNLAGALLAPSGRYEGKLDVPAVARRHGQADAESAGRFLLDLLLQPAQEAAGRLLRELPSQGDLPERLRTFVHVIATQPEFQLA